MVFAIFAAVAAGTLYIFFKTPPPQQESLVRQTSPKLVTQPAESKSELFKLIYIVKNDGITRLETISLNGGAKKIIYSDINDETKIKSIAGIKNDGAAVYLFSGYPNQPTGNLIELNLNDNPQTKTIKENVTSAVAPKISPVGDSYITVNFDNAEKSYGFAVVLNKFDGSGAKTLLVTQDAVTLLDFSSNGKKLAVVKALPAGGSQIVLIDITNGQSQGLYSTKGSIGSIDYEQDKVVFTDQLEIMSTDGDGKNVIRLTQNDLAESQLAFSPDEDMVAYLQTNPSNDNGRDQTQGNIALLSPKTKQETILTQGNGVIGWLK